MALGKVVPGSTCNSPTWSRRHDCLICRSELAQASAASITRGSRRGGAETSTTSVRVSTSQVSDAPKKSVVLKLAEHFHAK